VTSIDDDTADIVELVTDWVTRGWHLVHGEKFDFRARLERFYDWTSADVLLHDNADAKRTIARSADEYAAIWDSSLVTLTALSNSIDDGPHVTVSGDLALVDVCFSTRFEFEGGHSELAPTRSSLGLRRRDGRWLIFREHGSALSPQE
jgi:ketosteroid isomerase-like protein